MKNYLFLAFCFCSGLNAASYQSSMFVDQPNTEDAFLVRYSIEKCIEQDSFELVAYPEILCQRGKTAYLNLTSEDKSSWLDIEVAVSEDAQTVETWLELAEQNEIVFQFGNIAPMPEPGKCIKIRPEPNCIGGW